MGKILSIAGTATARSIEAVERRAVPSGQYVSFSVALQDIWNLVESQIEERSRGGFLGVGKVHEELLGIQKCAADA